MPRGQGRGPKESIAREELIQLSAQDRVQMVEVLRRDYPTKPFPEVAAAIGVSVTDMRAKAGKLGIRRQLDAMVAHASAAAALAKQQALRQGNKQ